MTFSHTFGNIGPGCSADCQRAMLERNTFEEELNCVPEGVWQLLFKLIINILIALVHVEPDTMKIINNNYALTCYVLIMFCSLSAYRNVLFYSFLCTVTNTHQWLMKLVSSVMLREVDLFPPKLKKRKKDSAKNLIWRTWTYFLPQFENNLKFEKVMQAAQTAKIQILLILRAKFVHVQNYCLFLIFTNGKIH